MEGKSSRRAFLGLAAAGVADGASALVSMGHDEYWTPAECANVTAARDAAMHEYVGDPIGNPQNLQ